MAGFPPGSAHGQPRLPALTLIGSGLLSNSFFDTPGLQPYHPINPLTYLSFSEQDTAWHGAEVAGCCNMPQPGGLADADDRIGLSQPDLESRQTALCQQPDGGGSEPAIGNEAIRAAYLGGHAKASA